MVVILPPEMIPRSMGVQLLVNERTAIELGLRAGEMRTITHFVRVAPDAPGASMSGALLFSREGGDAEK